MMRAMDLSVVDVVRLVSRRWQRAAPQGLGGSRNSNLRQIKKSSSMFCGDTIYWGAASHANKWSAPTARAFSVIVGVILALSFAGAAHAIVVGNDPLSLPNTTVNPAQYSGWTEGDPGWANFSTSGSYVYLGDGWVLSARHVGYTGGITFQTPSGPATFQRIPGSYYLDYGYLWSTGERFYAVENPASVQTETGQNVSLSQFTDLQVFRINGDPGLPALTIATNPLPANFVRTNAPQVVVIGGGSGRVQSESHWNATQQSQDHWIWSQTTGAGAYQGYTADFISQKRWGTNRVADPRPNGPGDPSDLNATDYSDLFEGGVVSDTVGVLKLRTPDGVTRDILGSMTVYDQQGQAGATSLETQALRGDSGSAVFYKRGNQWELAGIVNATYTYTSQPDFTAMYGNVTMFTDLSRYNQNYFHSLQHIIATHPDYSMAGDVNLDGIVSGNGTGPVSADDVAAFIAGWNYNNGLGQGTITSWKNGDLTRDGRTDVADFLRLRSALNGQISSAVVASLFGPTGIPEPSAAMLALVAAFVLAATRGRRRSSI
jgi:hypothetical protein